MNIPFRTRAKESGSTLAATVFMCMAIGIVLASYLNLTSQQNFSTMQSLTWNSTIPVLEAGLEEALAHIYYKTTPSTWGTDGWQLSGNCYQKTRQLSDDSYYIVAISNVSPPVIYSKGYVRMPLKTNYTSRTVKLTTRRDGLFSKGMVAKGQIDMSGNNVKTDSFDSMDPTYSTNGQYDPAKAKSNGDVATNSGLVNSLSVGNADIFGKVSTGPGGSVSVGSNGGVGDADWHANPANAGKIQPGWSSDDMNVSFPDVSLPFTGGYSTPGGNPLTISSSGNYQINGSLSKSLVVQSNVHVVLVVTGDISITGNNGIEIQKGGSLQLYMAGSSASIKGNGVMNNGGNATNFFYYGLPSNTSVAFGGNGAFTGAIYAPQAAFTLGGGGNDTKDFVGASVTSTVKMNGHFNFHYDENLGRIGPSRGFIVTSWNEISGWYEL